MSNGWLSTTAVIQREVYGYDLEGMTVAEMCDYLKNMVFAAEREIDEITREFSWKMWAGTEKWFNRQRILEEVVDTMKFLANILVGIGVTDEEFWIEYWRKSQINRERQKDGYYDPT